MWAFARVANTVEVTHDAGVQRRAFLQTTGAVVAAAAGAGGYAGLRSSAGLPRPQGPLFVLSTHGFGVLVLVAERVLDFEGAQPVAVAHGVDRSLRYASPESRAAFDQALNLLENGLAGLVTRGSPRLFSELGPNERDAALRAWGQGSIGLLRGAASGLRKLCLAVHYGPLEAARAVGYPGPTLPAPEPKPIQAREALSKPWVSKASPAP